MSEQAPETTLRDTLAAKFAEAAEAQASEAPAVTEAPAVEAPAQEPPASAIAGETAEQKAGRTAGRPRDEKGRLLPGPAQKTNAAPPAQNQQVSTVPAAPAPASAAPIQRPSSWKKDHWQDFDRIAQENPALANYLIQREQEFSKGVSTYKQEWDAAKPYLDAVAPHMDIIRQQGIDPSQLVGNLLGAHKRLAMGSEQEKLAMFQQLLPSYGLKAQLAVQGPDGQWTLLGQQQLPPPPQPQFNPQDIEKLVDQRLETRTLQQQIDAFLGNTEKYPHAKTVMQTMQGLLQAGLANSLDDAYEAALRHPRHADIYEAQQQQQRERDEAARREAELARVRTARAKTVSTPTSTPGGPGNGQGTPSLRDSLRQKLEAAAGGGRL